MIMGILKLVILAGLTCYVKSAEKALLELIAKHAVKPTVVTGDQINYTMVIRHGMRSKLDAVQIVISVLLPASVKFGALSTTNNSAYSGTLFSSNRAEFQFETLPIAAKAQFNFTAILIDRTLTSGLHYATTSIKVSHKSILVTGGISRSPFNFSNVFQVPFFVNGCLKPLGMTNGDIKFYQLSASSTQVDLKPYKARFNGRDDAWCADVVDRQPYIQVFLSKLTRLTGVATWGRKEKALWVKKYTMEYSLDGETWHSYGETGFAKRFVGNSDRTSKVLHWLVDPIVASFVRLRPIEWSVGVCLRFELYGCRIGNSDNCILPLGMESGAIPMASLSSHLPHDEGFPNSLNFSRLNKVVEQFPYGWVTASAASIDWLEVDLGSTYKVSALALQGGWGLRRSTGHVTKLKVRFSNDTRAEFRTILNEAKVSEKEFRGQQGGMLADMIYFSPMLVARYIRIIPLAGQIQKVMRFELYGCLVDSHLPEYEQEHQPPLSRRSVLLDKQKNTIFVCVFSDDRMKSICKRSSDGKRWRSINPSIMGILYQLRMSRRLFALDRNFHKAFSDDSGETWFTISEQELQRQIKGQDLINSTNIDNILPSKKPDGKLTWSAANGQKWGVSGNGIHVMDASEQDDWVLSATWKCCGS